MCHGHHQGSGDAFAAHVADAEKEFLVADEMVVKVATHHFGRVERTDYEAVVAQCGFFTFGQHVHLDFPCDIQLTINVFALQRGLLQLGDVLRGTLDNEGENQQTGQGQQQISPLHFYQRLIHLVVVIDDGDAPGTNGPWGIIIHRSFGMVFPVVERNHCDTPRSGCRVFNGAVINQVLDLLHILVLYLANRTKNQPAFS